MHECFYASSVHTTYNRSGPYLRSLSAIDHDEDLTAQKLVLVMFFIIIGANIKSSQVKSALLSILPHVQYIHTEN